MKKINKTTAIILAVIIGVIVVAIGAVAGATLTKTEATGATVSVIVPPGTQAKLDRGQGKGVIPSRIVGTAGDKLVIVNRDSVAHHVGPFYVEAGQRLNYSLSRPGVFSGECDLTETKRFAVIVKKA